MGDSKDGWQFLTGHSTDYNELLSRINYAMNYIWLTHHIGCVRKKIEATITDSRDPLRMSLAEQVQ